MLLTLTTTHRPATDLGYLLHKHPDRFQTFDLSAGKAHVFYPEASDERCTVALLLDLDPIQLVRGRQHAASLEQYVNDRPYVASSYLSVALARTFATAMNGSCVKRPELVDRPLPLTAKLTAVPAPGVGRPCCAAASSPSATRWRWTPSPSTRSFRTGVGAPTSSLRSPILIHGRCGGGGGAAGEKLLDRSGQLHFVVIRELPNGVV